MIIAAGLESIFAYCLGCKIFALLMRVGWMPEEHLRGVQQRRASGSRQRCATRASDPAASV